jgi:hypothetical protein
MTLFEEFKKDDQESPEQGPTNYTGVIIGLIALPLLVFFTHIGKPEMGLYAFISAVSMLFVVGIRWNLRGHFWFWATLVLVLLLHVLVVFLAPFPRIMVNRITLLPIGFADFLITLGVVRSVEKLIVKAHPSDVDA